MSPSLLIIAMLRIISFVGIYKLCLGVIQHIDKSLNVITLILLNYLKFTLFKSRIRSPESAICRTCHGTDMFPIPYLRISSSLSKYTLPSGKVYL